VAEALTAAAVTAVLEADGERKAVVSLFGVVKNSGFVVVDQGPSGLLVYYEASGLRDANVAREATTRWAAALTAAGYAVSPVNVYCFRVTAFIPADGNERW